MNIRRRLVPIIACLAAIAPVSAIVAANALAEELSASETAAPAPTPPAVEAPPVTTPPAPEPKPDLEEGDSLTAPPAPKAGQEGGGVEAKPKAPAKPEAEAEEAAEPETDAVPGGSPVPSPFALPSIPTQTCAPGDVPPMLIPIYQRAAAAYALGPRGPSILAAINKVETAFGTNLNVSSAGAIGWMQFMPETWAGYGVDADGDGTADPYNPEDAIHAAAKYLSASGAPTDWYGAIYAYNHADWYVAEVLAGAECFGQLGSAIAGAFDLAPKLEVLTCKPAKPWRKRIPADYMRAFEGAAARYGLSRRGVWALAGVAHLESDFGRGMGKEELKRRGPLGVEASEWKQFAVDGDGDGRIVHADPDDSAATLARMFWSRGDLRSGLFTHNQAKWYVDAVLADADRFAGPCKVSEVEWTLALPNAVLAPIKWENLTILNPAAAEDLQNGLIDPRIVGLLGAMTQSHTIAISALRSDHSMMTASGYVSNHYYGRAMDIAMVDGVSCTDVSPTAPCAQLAITLSQLPSPAMPTELIYCFDVDGPGPAFARSDHCDHVHAGYDG